MINKHVSQYELISKIKTQIKFIVVKYSIFYGNTCAMLYSFERKSLFNLASNPRRETDLFKEIYS